MLDQIKGLSHADALEAMEALWDRLTENGGEVPSPDWHWEELARRDALVEEGSITFSDWETAKERIRNRCK